MRTIRLFLLSFPLLVLAGCAHFWTDREALVYQEVFYVTTREDSGFDHPDRRYTGNRGEAAYGMAMVAINSREELSGSARPQVNHYQQQDQLLYTGPVQQVQQVDPDLAFEIAHRYGTDQPVREVLVFIHGYRRSFSDTVVNAAQLRYQMDFPGPVFAFAWPSTGSVSGYLADLQNLEWSVPVLEDLLERIVREFPGARIHILAHSMGCRALVQVLEAAQADEIAVPLSSLGQMVFMAPDLDRDQFLRESAERLRATGLPITLYVCSQDFPLMASTAVFQYPRLGDSREGVPVIEGIETIDVSEVINIFDGHGYYESDRDTIDDLYQLIRLGKPAPERPNMVEVEGPEGRYWKLLPPD